MRAGGGPVEAAWQRAGGRTERFGKPPENGTHLEIKIASLEAPEAV